jgi:hypothetical protein
MATLWMGRVVVLGGDRYPSGFSGLVYCTLTVRTHPSSPGQASTICPQPVGGIVIFCLCQVDDVTDGHVPHVLGPLVISVVEPEPEPEP